MPSASRSQQRLFGMVHAYQKGKLPGASDQVKALSRSIDPSDAEEFARTKHEGLPEKKSADQTGPRSYCPTPFGFQLSAASVLPALWELSRDKNSAQDAAAIVNPVKQGGFAMFPAPTPQLQKAASAAMTSYIRELANKVPAGTKAAEVQRNAQACNRLQKLAHVMSQKNDLFCAVAEVFADKSAAYRHQLINGLVRGLSEKLAKSNKQAGLGVTRHPSASVTGSVSSVPGRRTVGPASKSISPAA